jgi:hypothetical protein
MPFYPVDRKLWLIDNTDIESQFGAFIGINKRSDRI